MVDYQDMFVGWKKTEVLVPLVWSILPVQQRFGLATKLSQFHFLHVGFMIRHLWLV